MARLLDVMRASGLTGTQGRLRRRGVRRLRRAARRRAGELLPDAARARRRARRSRRSKGSRPTTRCTRSRSRSSSAAARSAASARRGWCWRRTSSCRGTRSRPKTTCASRSPATCAAAPATCASSRRCCDAVPHAGGCDDPAARSLPARDAGDRWPRRSTISRAHPRRAAVRRRDRSDGRPRSGAPAAGPLRQSGNTAASCSASSATRRRRSRIGALTTYTDDPRLGG